MRAALLVAMLLVACSPNRDPLQIHYDLSSGPSQSCPSTSCSGVPMSCDVVLQVRIANPADPTLAYVSTCTAVTAPETLCAISRVALPDTLQVPLQTVEVQIAIYPATAVTDSNGVITCPGDLEFGDDNLPVLATMSGSPSPSIAGRAFAAPSDDDVYVTLGCPDAAALTGNACLPPGTVQVTGSVDDFDTGVFVPDSLAVNLDVLTGEPLPRTDTTTQTTEYYLDSTDTTSLTQVSFSPVPSWQGNVATKFVNAACLEVLDPTSAQTTASVTCKTATSADTSLDLNGIRVAKSTLAEVLTALGDTEFPDQGLVLGMVVDDVGAPAPSITVVPSSGTVKYLSGDRSSITGQNATTTSGIFISTDAPFNTSWGINSISQMVTASYGGLINGKLTVVLIELREPTNL